MQQFLESTALFCGHFWLTVGIRAKQGDCKQILEGVIQAGFSKKADLHKTSFLPKLILLIPALLIPLLAIPSALASPADELDATSQQIGNLQAQSHTIDASYQQAVTDLVAVDSQVTRYSNEISDSSQRMAEIKASIGGEQKRLDECQAQLNNRQDALEKRLKGTYKSNEVGYLDVVMGAGDFSDFLDRVDMIQYIADEDRQLISSFQDAKNGVERQIASLSDKQSELAGTIDELNSAQASLVSAKSQRQATVDSLKSQKLANEGQLAQAQAEAATIETRMNQIQQQALASAPADGDSGYDASPPPAGGGASYTMEATAYCLGGTTATGMRVGRGVIAVDPRVIPLGSRVHVSGYGDAIAADTGGAISGNRIDVWLPCGEAYAWGVRTVTVTVY